MWFRKDVSKEQREVLLAELKQYKREVKMTPGERRELERFVAAGGSPYENGYYICGENGCPLDFMSALRVVEEENEYITSLSPEELEEYLHPTYGLNQDEELAAADCLYILDRNRSEDYMPGGEV